MTMAAAGKLTTAQQAAAPPPPPPTVLPDDAGKDKGKGPQQAVVLRVDVATKGQARLLTWCVWVLNTLFVLAAVALVATQSSYSTLGKVFDMFNPQLVFGSLCLAGMLLMLLWGAQGVQASRRERRRWSTRQLYFARTVTVLVVCQLIYSALYVAGVAIQVQRRHECTFAWTALTVLDFLRNLTFSVFLLVVLSSLCNLALWRGKEGRLDMQPDRLLLMDRPLAERLRQQWLILLVWAIFVATGCVMLVARLRWRSQERDRLVQGCDTPLTDFDCQASSGLIAAAAINVGVLFCVLAVFAVAYHRAIADHKSLPLARYRATHIFLRVQARVMGPVFFAVALASLLLGFIPVVLRQSCNSAIFTATGNLPVQLALTVAAVVLAVLYMPKAEALDSPLLQTILQLFSWAAADMPGDLQRRSQMLEDSEAHGGAPQSELVRALEFLPGKLRAGIGRLAHVQRMAGAVEQLEREPLFCMERACRLFYWARLAYRPDPAQPGPISMPYGLQLFGLEHWENVCDPVSDTHCVLGWDSRQAVLAFRGTASLQNVLSDVKAWRVTHMPRRRHRARAVTVHAGFYGAWLSGGFNRRVMDRLREVQAAAEGPLRFWVTGHSLGGALAALACSDISRELPDCQISCYTFGCPRVFNKAGADEYNSQVPDTWALINGRDPIPWIPKVGFKRVGKRVNTDSNGNLLLRPSYFELSVVQRGLESADHRGAAYAAALVSICKSQFSPLRGLPGGAEGVARISAALDLGACLCYKGMSLEALADQGTQPEAINIFAMPAATDAADADAADADAAMAAAVPAAAAPAVAPSPAGPPVELAAPAGSVTLSNGGRL